MKYRKRLEKYLNTASLYFPQFFCYDCIYCDVLSSFHLSYYVCSCSSWKSMDFDSSIERFSCAVSVLVHYVSAKIFSVYWMWLMAYDFPFMSIHRCTVHCLLQFWREERCSYTYYLTLHLSSVSFQNFRTGAIPKFQEMNLRHSDIREKARQWTRDLLQEPDSTSILLLAQVLTIIKQTIVVMVVLSKSKNTSHKKS